MSFSAVLIAGDDIDVQANAACSVDETCEGGIRKPTLLEHR